MYLFIFSYTFISLYILLSDAYCQVHIVWGGKCTLHGLTWELTRNSVFKYCFSSLWSIQKQAILGQTILKEICWMHAQFEIVKNLLLSKVRSLESHILFIVDSD